MSIIIITIGIVGLIINRKSAIIMLIILELISVGINLNYISTSLYLDDKLGQTYGLWIITIAAAESAIGLSILVAYYRIRGTLSITYINMLHN